MVFLPKISIVIAAYNSKNYLEDCINSIIKQTNKDFELIIIDGKSSDGTVDVIKKYSKYIDYWISEPDKGVYDAWNKALKVTKGEWICFIGTDDYFYNAKTLENVLNHLKNAKKNNNKIVYGKVNLVNSKKEIVEEKNESWNKVKGKIFQFMPYIHSGSFHHESLFINNGDFDSTFKIAGDYDFVLRELKNNSAYFINEIIICMGTDGLSNRLELKRNLYKEVLRARKNNGIRTLPWKIILSYLLNEIHLLIKRGRAFFFKRYNKNENIS